MSAFQIDVLVQDELWNVLADPAQVESSLINLAVNARDAMLEGGTLTIEARNVGRNERDSDLPEGEFVLLSVTDTGAGMTPDVLNARSNRSSPPSAWATAPAWV